MAKKSDKSRLLEDYNKKRSLVVNVLKDVLMSVQGRKIKPYNFGVARDGGFCVFIRGDGIGENELKNVHELVKKQGFIVYIATEINCYIIKPEQIKEYSGERAQKFKEVMSEEISRFHMRLVTG